MNIYVASSWRNAQQPFVVHTLRNDGHDVYDFKEHGFNWAEIDPDWRTWSPERYRACLDHPIARAGFAHDMAALRDCEACVLVRPCGISAHLELGWAVGAPGDPAGAPGDGGCVPRELRQSPWADPSTGSRPMLPGRCSRQDPQWPPPRSGACTRGAGRPLHAANPSPSVSAEVGIHFALLPTTCCVRRSGGFRRVEHPFGQPAERGDRRAGRELGTSVG